MPGALPTVRKHERLELGHGVRWPRTWLVMALARLGWSGIDGTPALHGGLKRSTRASEAACGVNGARSSCSAQPNVVLEAKQEYRSGPQNKALHQSAR